MIIGVLKEPHPETRVSLLPEHLPAIKKLNADVLIETGAGATAFASDEKYEQAGAKVVSRQMVLKQSTLLLSINLLSVVVIDNIFEGLVLLGN